MFIRRVSPAGKRRREDKVRYEYGNQKRKEKKKKERKESQQTVSSYMAPASI